MFCKVWLRSMGRARSLLDIPFGGTLFILHPDVPSTKPVLLGYLGRISEH